MPSKNQPRTFLVFGANGHIGGPAVAWLLERHPGATVRAATSNAASLEALAAKYPDAVAIHADYLNPKSLDAAFKDVDAAFIITPDFLDETTAMGNVVEAASQVPGLQRLIRLIGDPPGLRDEEEVPESLRKFKGGTAVQHARARKVLSASKLPVVYLNICAWFMDDFATFMLPPLASRQTLVMPYDRIMNYIDTRDIGRAAAELLMDPGKTEVGETYHLHNGVDMMIKFSDVAPIFTEALGTPFSYDGSLESFHRDLGPSLRSYYKGVEDAVGYYEAYILWERSMTIKLSQGGADLLNGEKDLHPRALGFEPRPFKEWIAANRSKFLPA